MNQPSGARGSLIMLAVFLGTASLGYIFSVVLAWILPADEYGTYAIAIASLSILSLFIVHGIPWTVVKLLSAEDSHENRLSIFKSSLVTNFTIGIIVSFAFLGIYILLPNGLDLTQTAVALMIAIVITFSIRAVYVRALHGLMKFEHFGIVAVIQGIARLSIGLGLVYVGLGVNGALAGELVGGLASLLCVAYLLRNFKFWQSKRWVITDVLPFAGWMFIGMSALTSLSQFDILGLKLFEENITDDSIGYFQAARLLALTPFFITGGIMAGIFPFISKNAGQEEKLYIIASLRYIAIITLPITISLILIPTAIIDLFFPQEYTASADALRILAAGGIFLALNQGLANIFQASGQPSLPAKTLFAALMVEIALLPILVPNHGLNGAALSMTAANLAGSTWLLFRLIKVYRLGIPNWRLFIKFVTSLTVSGAFLYYFPHNTLIMSLLDLILAGILYLVLLTILKLIISEDIDTLIRGLPKNRLVETAACKLKESMQLLQRIP